MGKIKTFETLKNERQLKRYLGSPYGTLYYPLDEQQGNRTMVRHFDSDLPSEFIAEYIELYGLVKQWVDSNPNVNEIVFIKELIDVGEDYIIRSYYVSIRHYFDKEKFNKSSLEFERMKKIVIASDRLPYCLSCQGVIQDFSEMFPKYKCNFNRWFKMKITEIMFSGLAARQYVNFFNDKNNLEIEVYLENKEGISFVTVDFKQTSIEKALSFMYKLGELQEELRNEGELMLPIEKYPLSDKK